MRKSPHPTSGSGIVLYTPTDTFLERTQREGLRGERKVVHVGLQCTLRNNKRHI